MRSRNLAVLVLVLVAAVTNSGCLHRDGAEPNDARNAEKMLAAYIEELPARVSEVETFGPVTQVNCVVRSRTTDPEPVFLCFVSHRNGTVAEWCTVVDGDRVRTNHELRDGDGPGCV